MLVSIITVSFNSAKTIKDTINSVLSQSHDNIEYIIVDGKSTDGTLDIVQSYGNKISKFVTEPDEGIYDAMNKGIALATGEVIGILNSDDFYINEYVIETVVKEFEAEDVDSIYADLVYVKADNLDKVVRYYDSSYFSPNKFAYGLMPAHPTFFVKKWVYEQYGVYDMKYKVAADFDIVLRFLLVHGISYRYLKQPLVKMRFGGASTSLSSFWVNTTEQLKSCRNNRVKTNFFKILSKYPPKLLGYFVKD